MVGDEARNIVRYYTMQCQRTHGSGRSLARRARDSFHERQRDWPDGDTDHRMVLENERKAPG